MLSPQAFKSVSPSQHHMLLPAGLGGSHVLYSEDMNSVSASNRERIRLRLHRRHCELFLIPACEEWPRQDGVPLGSSGRTVPFAVRSHMSEEVLRNHALLPGLAPDCIPPPLILLKNLSAIDVFNQSPAQTCLALIAAASVASSLTGRGLVLMSSISLTQGRCQHPDEVQGS